MQNSQQPAKRIVFTSQPGLAVKRFDKTPDAPAKITLVGRPILWNVLSTDRGGYVVRLLPNSAAFADVVFALYNHEFSSVIGSTANGTLRISSDEVGVTVEIDLPDTSTGRDVAQLVEDRYVTGMSFSMAFGPEESEAVKEGDQQILNVSKYTVDEVTVTPIPAFPQTSIDVETPDEENSLSLAKELDAARVKYEMYRLGMYDLDRQSIG